MKRSRRSSAALAAASLQALPALAFAAFGTGCVGYNHTLFVTKSNAGLDFDTQPPTTEVTVSRKEGVIAPSFEQGKTPPVMASFQARTGQGAAFKSFFFGVDQTFAGGDAALVMAGLYDSKTVPELNTLDAPGSDYDSALEIEKPSANSWWKKIPGPGSTTPFLFATDTMFGLKIGWSSAAQLPDSLKAGFNRKEFAWAPLSQSAETPSSTAGGKPLVKVSSPSFIATVDSSTRTEGSTAKTGTLQYFATGKAAVYLARQPAVRNAMLSRLDPSFRAKLGVEVLGEALASVDMIIANLATGGNPAAQLHSTRLANLDGYALPATFGAQYTFSTGTSALAETNSATAPDPRLLGDLIAYDNLLAGNLRQLNDAWQPLQNGTAITFQAANGTPAIPLTADKLAGLRIDFAARQKQLRDQLSRDPVILDAYLFVQEIVSPR